MQTSVKLVFFFCLFFTEISIVNSNIQNKTESNEGKFTLNSQTQSKKLALVISNGKSCQEAVGVVPSLIHKPDGFSHLADRYREYLNIKTQDRSPLS